MIPAFEMPHGVTDHSEKWIRDYINCEIVTCYSVITTSLYDVKQKSISGHIISE